MKIKGKGSVIRAENKEKRKCRHWFIQFNTEEGVVRSRYTGTYSDACEELERRKAELEMADLSTTFREYALKWLKRRERSGEIATSTLDKERRIITKLCKEFSDMRLIDMTPEIAVEGLLNIKEDGNYSGTYMNGIHVKMKTILEDAVDNGYINRNPLAKVKAPKTDTKERTSLSTETVSEFLSLLSQAPLDSHTIGVRIAVLAGLRRGELVGLIWDDFEDGVLKVRRSVTERMEVKSPKTLRGIRNIPLPQMLIDDLNEWQRIQERYLRSIGIKQTLNTPIIVNEIGSMMHPQNLNRWWRQNRDRFGCEGIVLHELRHTYLTILANSGAPSKTLQTLAGWSDIKMANIYVHRDETIDKQSVRKLDDLLASYLS